MPWYARGKVKDIKPWPQEEKVLKKHGRPSGLHMVQVEWAWDGPQSPKTHEVPSHALARPDEYDAVLEGVRAAATARVNKMGLKQSAEVFSVFEGSVSKEFPFMAARKEGSFQAVEHEFDSKTPFEPRDPSCCLRCSFPGEEGEGKVPRLSFPDLRFVF